MKLTLILTITASLVLTGSITAQNMEPRISETARENRELLWPDERWGAMATDPELIEVFGNFAFDEVVTHDEMPTKLRILMIMASTIGSESESAFRMMANAALNVGATPVEVKEIVYQSVPYVGFSKAVGFIAAANEILNERGIALPLEGQSTSSPETRFEAVLARQKEIFGNVIDNNYKNSPEDLLHIQRYLSANCFGDYVTRGGLDVRTRELATLSFLIALGGVEPQIKGHIQGNLNVGNDRQSLIDLITQLLPYVGYPRTLNAIACLNEVAPSE